MMTMRIIILILLNICFVSCHENKYSEAANTGGKYEKFEKEPFRMNKLNLIWAKALKRLSEPKLKALLSELKIQDKEELTLKKLKLEAGDKDGLKEADLRKKLRGILAQYHLDDFMGYDDVKPGSKESYLNEVGDQKVLKAVFKDKKLNKLWEKAEQSGFTEAELKALKEEFNHHQDKVNEYHALLKTHSEAAVKETNDLENDIEKFDHFQDMEKSDKFQSDPTNSIRDKHQDLKQDYIRLHKVATTGPQSKEFVEPKVAGLWKVATQGDFSVEELESLHTELKHYEHRLLKVRYMTGQLDVIEGRVTLDDQEKLMKQTPEGKRIMKERLEKQQRKMEKLHEDLEWRIMQRRSEL